MKVYKIEYFLLISDQAEPYPDRHKFWILIKKKFWFTINNAVIFKSRYETAMNGS